MSYLCRKRNSDVEDFLSLLNESQRQAVTYNDGPSLVIAGAGSGKTRVLTYKIAGLLQQGYAPSSILALTFTNKAAREMKDRIAGIVGENLANKLWMGTFHSVFYRILRIESDNIGFPSDFTIYDSADSKNLIKTIIKGMKLDEKTYNPNKVHARISQLKNNLVTPQSYMSRNDLHEVDMHARMPLMKDIFTTYTNRCLKAGVMDFDDLLLYTNILFRDHPGVLVKYQNYFKFILVDEYQDTNFAQHLIIKKLADRHHKVCVVGDDAQSIYSFRGANIENILRFQEVYPECKLFKLEQNYRSTQNIVRAANSLIDKNKEQIKKNVFSENSEGNIVKVFSAYSDTEESNIVANAILAMHQSKKYEYKDFAILYRTNAQSRILEEAMRKKGVPYKIYGGLSFYQRKEIKDVLAYFKLSINHADEEAFKRVINYPARGIGETTVSKIAECANMHNVSFWDVISNPLGYNLQVNSGTALKIGNFRMMMEEFTAETESKSAYDMATTIIHRTGILKELYQDKTPENMTRQQNIEELLKSIHEFCETKEEEEGEEMPLLNVFLQEVSLLTDQDNNKNENLDMITMMTVHASKGLEFKNVFIVGMEEELFPSNMSTGSEESIEEERRLFYVAITRAEENCYITYAKSRFRNGSSAYCNPSRFLKDIDPDLLELPDDYKMSHGRVLREALDSQFENFRRQEPTGYNLKIKNTTETTSFKANPPKFNFNLGTRMKPMSSTAATPNPNSISNFSGQDNSNIKVGDFVEHEKFGIGKVTQLEGLEGSTKATIEFRNSGVKKILLKYAKLKVIKG
ncbi:MAG: exodeoxyribonuclease V subunit gamma [Paludibacteraceae bacterium]|nr:exodeoxyribonuclease V subunit gamma [Paludibacteraceae bacterium]HOU67554.1 exodeoxyribonuclease V subunit gamma [Paludibacteraceae bacterium]HQF49598.1 exodeoxyribonuclease V subunit gamma [Paludibacteraceae bacterium]HQJ89721.1 exodeoxyribonuclease V subunit gamma [Paludibacteraceae bacterium]